MKSKIKKDPKFNQNFTLDGENFLIFFQNYDRSSGRANAVFIKSFSRFRNYLILEVCDLFEDTCAVLCEQACHRRKTSDITKGN